MRQPVEDGNIIVSRAPDSIKLAPGRHARGGDESLRFRDFSTIISEDEGR